MSTKFTWTSSTNTNFSLCKSCLTANRCGSTWETANTASNPGTCSTDGDCTGGDTCFKPGTTSWTNCTVDNPVTSSWTLGSVGHCPYADHGYLSPLGQALYWRCMTLSDAAGAGAVDASNCNAQFCTDKKTSSCEEMIYALSVVDSALQEGTTDVGDDIIRAHPAGTTGIPRAGWTDTVYTDEESM